MRNVTIYCTLLIVTISFPLCTCVTVNRSTEEKSKIFKNVAGFQIGTVIGLVLSGWLCSSTFLGGWPSAFYVFGVCGLVWGVAWCCFIYERPEEHPGLSDADLRRLRLHQESVKGKEVRTLSEGRDFEV